MPGQRRPRLTAILMRQDDLSDDQEDTGHSSKERARAGARSTWVNVGLATTQVIVGIFARAQGLIAGGVHSLSDLVEGIVVLSLACGGAIRKR